MDKVLKELSLEKFFELLQKGEPIMVQFSSGWRRNISSPMCNIDFVEGFVRHKLVAEQPNAAFHYFTCDPEMGKTNFFLDDSNMGEIKVFVYSSSDDTDSVLSHIIRIK